MPINNHIVQSTTIIFDSDGLRLKGVLNAAAGDDPPIVIGSHGLLSIGNSPKQMALAETLNIHGISYFRFDHRGCGESEGDFRQETSLDSRKKDLLNAVKALQEHGVSTERIGLFGSSFGGSAVLSAFKDISPKAAVILASPVKSGPVSEALLRLEKSIITGENQRPFLPDAEFVEKCLRFDIENSIGGISKTLVIHGEKDEIVPLKHAHIIFSKLSDPKELIVFPDGDHRVSNPAHQKIFLKMASSWFRTYLTEPQKKT